MSTVAFQSVGARRTAIAERMVRYAWRLYSGGDITTEWMRNRFGISKMTASRDMAALRKALAVDEVRVKHNRRRVKLSRRPVHLLDAVAPR